MGSITLFKVILAARFKRNISTSGSYGKFYRSGTESCKLRIMPTLEEFSHQIKNDVPCNYERAIRYLQSSVHNIGNQSIMFNPEESATAIPVDSEVFSSALIYDVIRYLPGLEIPKGLLSFIQDHMSDYGFFQYYSNRPHQDEVNTTALCIYALFMGGKIDLNLAISVARALSLNCISEAALCGNPMNKNQGRRIIRVFFPPHAPNSFCATAVDEGTMAISMRLLYSVGLESAAVDTEDYLFDWVQDSQRFHQGSIYYSPDVILYFLSNCVSHSKKFHLKFKNVLTARLEETLGSTVAPIDLSMRIITAHNVGILPTLKHALMQETSTIGNSFTQNMIVKLAQEAQLLSNQQKLDGSWELDPIFRFHSLCFSNRTVVTAFGAKALFVSFKAM